MNLSRKRYESVDWEGAFRRTRQGSGYGKGRAWGYVGRVTFYAASDLRGVPRRRAAMNCLGVTPVSFLKTR